MCFKKIDKILCHKCRKYIIGYPAISRKDNKTEICSKCGTLEGLEKFIEYKKLKKNSKGRLIMEENKTILKLYENFRDENCLSSKRYKEISNRFLDRIEKFEKRLKKKDKKELDKIINLSFQMSAEDEKDVFIYAYSLGVRLTMEALYEIREK